ncbi:MAG: UPF0179 family protein [Thermoprotei archaeon]
MNDNSVSSEYRPSGKQIVQKRVNITMVPVGTAKLGYTFTFARQPGPECRSCPVRAPCLDNLTQDDTYTVKEVKTGEHFCALTGLPAKAVVVEKAELIVNMEKHKVMPGALVNYSKIQCDWVFCKNFTHCVCNGLKNGDRVKLHDKGTTVECPRGFKLLELRVRR